MTAEGIDAGDPAEQAARLRATATELYGLGKLPEALDALSAALTLTPGDSRTYYARGIVLEALGDSAGASDAYRASTAREPALAGAWINLGRLEDQHGDVAGAARCYDRGLMIDPDEPLALANLGELFLRSGDLDTARALLEAAANRAPKLSVATFNLARARLAEHRLPEANDGFSAAYVNSHPSERHYADAHLLAALCDPKQEQNSLTEAHQSWGRAFCTNTATLTLPERDRSPNRPLVIGLVSGDFNNHPASRFLEPLFIHHDRSRFDFVAYHTTRDEDEVTDRLRTSVRQWRQVTDWSTDRLVDRILTDRIDILIDLAGHTRGNRLDVFARKPATLQGEWLGYLHSSGLPTIDFRLGDPLMDDPNDLAGPVEALPDGIWCYAPYDHCPGIERNRETTGGPPLFGSFNNPMKINELVLECWAGLLRSIPGSALVLAGFNHRAGQITVSQFLGKHGIGAERLKFLPKMPTDQYLRALASVPVALDPFPYGGGTTTFDSLWMGTPVVAMSGSRTCGRGSAAILTRLGLTELIARDHQDYVDIARELALRRPPTSESRLALRHRLATSPLACGPTFCRSVENALRARWTAR